ncbi:hypothetical protein IKG68_02460 [Candidatus Saccharibacteria bacterium]|nr:hypothetical protein [Candidatus Saccharibacteria bacterium]
MVGQKSQSGGKQPGKGMNTSINVSEIIEKVKSKLRRNKGVPLEINLVPDVKNEMIRTLKLRNFVFFLSIVVASVGLGATAIFASIAGGQQAIVDGKKNTVDALSKKINSYSDLSDFLTIKDQLGNIATIADNKKLLSRMFGTLSSLLPTNGDTITISELNVNLEEEAPVISFDAYANANNAPFIDYNVLDAFKKSMQYMRYDYGRYVDKTGTEIPAYCMIENGEDGATLTDREKGIYAYWTILEEGCNPSYEPEEEDDEEGSTDNASGNTSGEAVQSEIAKQTAGYNTETYNNYTVVKIWRTPQFNDWYHEEVDDKTPTITLDGEIVNVAHFASECIKYAGYLNESTGVVNWTNENESCATVPDGIDGITISDSSNGRDSDDQLVLRFSASIVLNPDVFNFNNKHVLAIGPSGRYNVTDSFVQIQSMFGARATDCAEGDTVCFNNATGGGA